MKRIDALNLRNCIKVDYTKLDACKVISLLRDFPKRGVKYKTNNKEAIILISSRATVESILNCMEGAAIKADKIFYCLLPEGIERAARI